MIAQKPTMVVEDIEIQCVDLSELNTRKNLADGQHDSTVDDLARSIKMQGLLSPVTVVRKAGGRYGLIAGQRRLSACKLLGWPTIPAIVRDGMTAADATAVSLVENVHRADMNPLDKAVAFKALLDRYGDLQAVSRETGVGTATIRKYVQLLDLAPDLQEKLAAGEAKNTEALAQLAQKFDPETQRQVWDSIAGFNQNEQREIIKRADPDLENLDDLVDQATEGAFNYRVMRNCPFDCPTIPEPLKQEVAEAVETFKATGIKKGVRARLRSS